MKTEPRATAAAGKAASSNLAAILRPPERPLYGLELPLPTPAELAAFMRESHVRVDGRPARLEGPAPS